MIDKKGYVKNHVLKKSKNSRSGSSAKGTQLFQEERIVKRSSISSSLYCSGE